MLKVFGLLVLLSLSNSFECNKEGYIQYLAEYGFKGIDEPEQYKEDHLGDYIVNCNQLNSLKKTCGFADFTALMDWSYEELEELGKLGVQYSGNPVLYAESFPNQNEMSVEKRSRDFTDLKDHDASGKPCSTSWATAAIRAAEAALNYRVELSEEQLFTCLPKDLGFANGCEGIHPKKLMGYLLEEGLVEKDAFNGCDKLDGLTKYRFSPNIPEVPTAGGLMNLLANDNKPAFVMMAVDLQKLRFVKDMTNIKDVVKCGGYQPSLYGVLTGYKYSEGDKSAWWEVVTNVIPGEEIVMKIPMSANMENANYAGIAAYAFTLSEEVEPTTEPTTEPPTAEPTTIPPTPVTIVYEDLVIATNDDCEKLNDLSRVKSLTVNEGLCNDMKGDLVIANYPGLKEIVIKLKSLQNLNSLTIMNNTELIKIETEDKENPDDLSLQMTSDGPFVNIKSVTISGMIID